MNRKGSGIPQPSGSGSGSGPSGIPRRAPSPSSAAFGFSSSSSSSAISAIPRRAPSPANAAFSSASTARNDSKISSTEGRQSSAGPTAVGMTPSRSSAGPMGGYRPGSRGASNAGDASFRSVTTPSTAGRFGFSAGANSNNGGGRASLGLGASGHKRSSSAAGFNSGDESSLDGPPKRPLLAGSTPSAPSPRFPAPSPSQDRQKYEAELEKQKLQHEARYASLEKENRSLAREIERFHAERAMLLKQWDESQESTKEEREASREEKKKLEELVKELSAASGEMQQKLDEAETHRAQASQSAHKQTTELESRSADLESQLAVALAEAQRANEGQQRLQTEFDQKRKEWEDDKANSSSSNAHQPSEDAKKLTEQLSGLMQHVRKLEAENGGLKADNKLLKGRAESIETLKEQKRDLENKVGILDELRRKCAEGETTIASLERERDEWTQQLSSGDSSLVESTHASFLGLGQTKAIPTLEAPSPLTAKTLPRYLSLLQGAVSGLSKRSEGLNEQLASARSRCDDADDLVEKLRLRLKAVEAQLDAEGLGRRKGEKMVENLKLEVDSYKRLLESYQEEAKNASSPVQYDGATAERIRMLDARVEELREEAESSNKELEQMRAKASEAVGGLTASEAREMQDEYEKREKEAIKTLEEEKSKAVELEKECTRLGQEVDELYLRVGRGEFDQNKLRCLELKDNPVSRDRVIRNKTLDALSKENEELVKQLEEVSKRVTSTAGSEGDAPPPGLVPVQTLENHKAEYQKLEQAMKDRDKAFARLKEAFGAKAAEYVAAVKALFGYDMHVVSRGKVKLRSVYARSSRGTSLTFNSEDGDVGNMRLMGEARQGMANVNHLRSYWLGDARQSVPCFLAALQLELYESTTRAIRTTWEATEE